MEKPRHEVTPGRPVAYSATDMSVRLVELDDHQVTEAAGMLGRAFRDNPGWKAVLHRQSPEVRQRVFEQCSRGFLKASRQYGITTAAVADGRIAGITLVYPPDTYPLPAGGQLQLVKGVLASGLGAFWRYSRLGAYMWRVHPQKPHYYLFMIGVDPDSQGKGYGGQLLRRLNDVADNAGADCYLETDKPESVSLYEHFGYRVVRADTIRALGNLRMWTMTRPGSS